MQYITSDDLIIDSYQKLIAESSQDFPLIIENTEARAIALVKTYLVRYDTDTIFGLALDDDDEPIPPIRHELLVEIICKIVLYKIFRRNAARKVPEDVQKDYDWAIKELDKVRSGITTLELPPAIDENGQPISTSIWGNNTNPDFYI